MKISRVWAVYFSPTGNVKEVTNLIAKKLSGELSVPLEQWDFTLPDNRKSAKAFEKGFSRIWDTGLCGKSTQ